MAAEAASKFKESTDCDEVHPPRGQKLYRRYRSSGCFQIILEAISFPPPVHRRRLDTT